MTFNDNYIMKTSGFPVFNKYETGYFYKKIDTTGPQVQMITHGRENGYKIYLRNEYIYKKRECRLFGGYKKFEQFRKILLNCVEKEEKVVFHEFYLDKTPCKLFFDLDLKKSKKDISEQLIDDLQYYLNSYIQKNDLWDKTNIHPLLFNFDYGKFIVTDIISSSKKNEDGTYRISLHLLCNQIFFKNILEQKKFVVSFINYVSFKFPDNILVKLIDLQVYCNKKSLRTVYSSKIDEDRPCLPLKNIFIEKEIADEYNHDIYLYLYFITVIPNIKNIIFMKTPPIVVDEECTPFTKKFIMNKTPVICTNDISNDYQNINIQNLKYGVANTFHEKCVLIKKVLDDIDDSYFADDVNGYQRRLLLTFAVANYFDKDAQAMNIYIDWLRNKRISLGQEFDVSLDKYKKAYFCQDKNKGKLGINYIKNIVLNGASAANEFLK